MSLDEQAQTCFHRPPFRRQAGMTHGLFDQMVIDINVGSHCTPSDVYK